MSDQIISPITDDDTWPVIESFFNEYGLVHHQIESYNAFIKQTPDTISKNVLVTNENYRVTFEGVKYEKPCHKEIDESVSSVNPKQCIDRNISYVSHMFTDITMQTPYGTVKKYKNVHIGSMPVMVYSKLCNLYEIKDDKTRLAELEEDLYDKGGYFIINGAAKIIASQQRTAHNKIYVFANRKDRPRYEFYSEIRSSANSHTATTYVGIKEGLITVVIPYIENIAIPLGIAFRALGIESYESMLECITHDKNNQDVLKIIESSLEQSFMIKTQNDALCYIGKKGKKYVGKNADKSVGKEVDEKAISYAKHLITNELFPHVGTDFTKKKYYLGLMISKLLNVYFGKTSVEDRDHYANKRIATVGTLFSSLFYTAFRKLRSEITNSLERCVKGSTAVNITTLIKPALIKSTMCNALTSNVWGGRGKQQGISQTFDRFNYTSSVANARKFITPMSAEGGKVEGPRHLHNSHWAVVCPAETPEGKKCLVFGTKIMTPKGTINIENLKNGDIVYAVNPRTLEYEKTAISDYFTVKKRVKKIKCGELCVTATDDHPFLIFGDRGTLEWKNTSDISVGDKMVMKYIEPVITTDYFSIWARIIGYCHKNAFMKSNHEWTVKFRTMSDVINFSKDLKLFGFPYDIYEFHGGGKELFSFKMTFGMIFVDKLNELGYTFNNFSIPEWIINNEDIMIVKEYIAGLQTFESDILDFSCDDKERCIFYANWLKNAYKSFGVESKYNITQTLFGFECSFLFLNNDCMQILENVGYRYDRTRTRNSSVLWCYMKYKNQKTASEKDLIDFYNTNYISNNSHFLSVDSITNECRENVADFTTASNYHSFVANGFVTHNCGLVTNASMQCLVTMGSDSDEVEELIRSMNIIEFDDCKSNPLAFTKIFINGDFIAVTKYAENIVNELVQLRRSGGINPEIGIYFDKQQNEILISTDAGRLCRPLLIIENGKISLKKSDIEDIKKNKWSDKPGNVWSQLISGGFVELVDKLEEEGTLISTFPSDLEELPARERIQYTHCELHPSMIFGVGASIIPHSNTNQSPRNTYQASMSKQAVGVPGTNYLHQTKGKFHVLNYPQKPLVTTKIAKLMDCDKLPAGQNAVVMVCPWYGYGQEDSIIMNQDSIDRGFMNVTTFIGFDGRVRKDRFEKFEVPSRETCSNYKGNNSKLDSVTGIVSEGQTVEDGDILIGITMTNEKASIHQHQKISISVLYDQPIKGKIHKIQKGRDGDGYEYVRIVVTQQRNPEYGDKFAALPGQKGTVGMTMRSMDLPFTREGIVPDILLNPLALPSRMTIGLLIEIIQGRKIASSSSILKTPAHKAFCHDKEGWDNPKEDYILPEDGFTYKPSKLSDDGTPFNKDFSLRKICDELKSMGINEFSDEVVTNGLTGEQMTCMVFTGICFYQRLKHMVVEKVHARSRGGRTRLTRQPREGRRIGGGFRVGVMEKDALLGNGAPHFTKDRLMEQSDQYEMWFCEICGLQAIVTKGDDELGIAVEKSCRICDDNRVFKVRLPYATKLLMQEFAGMNVMIRVLPSKYKKKAKVMMGDKLLGEGDII